MPTPFQSRQAAKTSSSDATNRKPNHNVEWRCTRCDKLLGVSRDSRMHLRFSRGHEYFVGFPVQSMCRACGTLNHADAPE